MQAADSSCGLWIAETNRLRSVSAFPCPLLTSSAKITTYLLFSSAVRKMKHECVGTEITKRGSANAGVWRFRKL